MQSSEFDVVVVGGGINGAGIARDLAGRGLSVLLCEKDDLARHTSSASTKLIHGGLRYLEYYEFGLVRKALQEREVLLRAAPHIMWPLRFVMPHDSHLRPAWMIRMGLFLYDHLARRKILPGSNGINLRKHPAGQPLRQDFGKGFVYSDGWVQDARLVTLCVMDAHERGAVIQTRTRCTHAERNKQHWEVNLQDEQGERRTIKARALVNAAGPWVGDFLRDVAQVQSKRRVRLIKGSHIVVKKLYDHPYAYIFQNPDKRIIFAIPYEQDFTLIGTTDIEYRGAAEQVVIDADEVNYLCNMASRYFTQTITPADVVWDYSGVRPLLDDESDDAAGVTRDYDLTLDQTGAPLLSVFGGKITTFRKLAEEAGDMLQQQLAKGSGPWTAQASLPGGDMPAADFDAFLATMRAEYPWLPQALAQRWARSYGTRCAKLLHQAHTLADFGEEVLPGLYEREVRYLCDHEWARSAQDILWRRSKLGLHLAANSAQQLDAWLASHVSNLSKTNETEQTKVS
ncbi:glycerol-3-phosphate dehydrogenase [Chitinimonas sp. BJB300]|uniref:glycerol-3-phosphate dehydrogenase n=1 Tax=Chitinimonas sp. BJB300 TaxID=1559339 RepID=UPI000C111D93|nr:glycerol-3-phosphate dehydrogenase [Chitinimonas sp. BJB300]PHV10933.1 glycerol-3-phosphate dehydrogenase [Chitinimonas sp. BJB300]TSJ86031.1 glycerol-3-phosphate dehydrogenase [Chitinimonas sp. BJB300]